jgi:hypothetical protein
MLKSPNPHILSIHRNSTAPKTRLKPLYHWVSFFFPSIMRPYQYLPLHSEASNIRVITLLPACVSDCNENRILLDTIQIQKGNEYQYETFSYTWESAEDPVAIYVGASADQIHLRHPKSCKCIEISSA